MPTIGTEYSRHAAEIAFSIGRSANAIVDVGYVVERSGEVTAPDEGTAAEIGEQIANREGDLGREFGAEVSPRVLVSDREPEAEILGLAEERDDDLIVMGTNIRPLSGKAFFGHRVAHVVANADCPVAVIASA